MLWLAGLMGLMAVGAVTFIDTDAVDQEEEPTSLPPAKPHPGSIFDPPSAFGALSDAAEALAAQTRAPALPVLEGTTTEDSLVLIWDDQLGTAAEPEISMKPNPDALDQTLILMNGEPVALINSTTIQVADIALVGQSAAETLGLIG